MCRARACMCVWCGVCGVCGVCVCGDVERVAVYVWREDSVSTVSPPADSTACTAYYLRIHLRILKLVKSEETDAECFRLSGLTDHEGNTCHQSSAISHQSSVISHQPSAISHQSSNPIISHQPSAISHQPSAISSAMIGAAHAAVSVSAPQCGEFFFVVFGIATVGPVRVPLG